MVYFIHDQMINNNIIVLEVCVCVCVCVCVYIYTYTHTHYIYVKNIYILHIYSNFRWDKFFSNRIKLLSHYVPLKSLYRTTFLFSSFRRFHLSNGFLYYLTCLNLEFSFAFHLILEFLFCILSWMLVTSDKAKCSLQKHW